MAMKQTENTEMVQTRLSPFHKGRLRKAAVAQGLSDAAFVRKIIIENIDTDREKIAGPEVWEDS